MCRHGRNTGHEWLEDRLCPECEDNVDVEITEVTLKADLHDPGQAERFVKRMTELLEAGYQMTGSHASDLKLESTFQLEEHIPHKKGNPGITFRKIPIYANMKWRNIV